MTVQQQGRCISIGRKIVPLHPSVVPLNIFRSKIFVFQIQIETFLLPVETSSVLMMNDVIVHVGWVVIGHIVDMKHNVIISSDEVNV